MTSHIVSAIVWSLGGMDLIGAIDYHLRQDGYRFLRVQPQEAGVYYRYIDGVARVIVGLNVHEGFTLNGSQMELLQRNLRELFLHPQGRLKDYPTDTVIYDVHMLTLLVTADAEGNREMCTTGRNTWMYDIHNDRLMIYENQPGDFYGLRQMLQKIADEAKDTRDGQKVSMKQRIAAFPVMNTVVVVINILVFAVLSFLGNTEDSRFMVEHGAMYPSLVLDNGQWYRLLTSMFLHFGFLHLANNMVMLFFAGKYLEDAVGKIKYLIIYFAAGLGGSIFSLYMMVQSNDMGVSAGASGAIFGVIGALLWVAIKNRGKFENLTTPGLLIMIGLCLYYGFSSTGVDNWCHIGGLICGFVASSLLYRVNKS